MHELGHLHPARLQEVRLLSLGQHQQVIHEPVHPVQLFGHQRDRLSALGWIVSHQLQMTAHDRDRGTQLVPRVGQERPLGGERPVQPADHRVERAGQVATSSLPLTGMRRDRSVSSMARAVSVTARSGRNARPMAR
nr:hypothetical protein [Micromonospora deserti]